MPTPTPTTTPTSTPHIPTRDTRPPSTPANLRLGAKTNTSIGLLWDAATDNVTVVGYEVRIGATMVATATDTVALVDSLAPDTSYIFSVRAKDAAGNLSAASAPLSIRTRRIDGLPSDPADVASPVDQTGPSDFAANTMFLYSGPNVIQTGVAPQTIDARRAAVLRGLVLTRDGRPLPGVTITILGHPEYGQTQSRADGIFDLAVNGGGLLTISYAKDGYLPAQRQVDAPWRDFAWLPDVALIPLDTAVTTVTLDGAHSPQIARGNIITDTDGARRATLLFPANLTATLVLSDNTTVPLTTLHIRATEYSVGPNGPKAMPGQLPANSAYTYAAEFSADEAIAVGAKTVRFSQPIINYTENFLRFPVGVRVPTGYYDRDHAVWVPSDNGRVIAIVGVTDGLADLDITGDGHMDGATALGVTEAERRQLAELYRVGQELWRVPIPHFTPWDHNWPFGPPWDAVGPNGGPPWGDNPLDDPCLRSGSVVECQNQTLGEVLAVVGTPFSLHYQSDRVDGRSAAKALRIPVSRGELPASLDHIELEISVAGRRIVQSFSSPAGQAGSEAETSGLHTRNAGVAGSQVYNFSWDGRDVYGRQLQGAQPIGVQIGYVYPIAYRLPLPTAQSFGSAGLAPMISLNRAGAQATLAQSYRSLIGPLDVRQQGLGGWTLDVHHTYDPRSGTLYRGDGSRHGAQQLDGAVTIAGYCLPDSFFSGGYSGDGAPAIDASLKRPSGIAFGPDGSLYIADRSNQRIRRIDLDGIITTVAGNGQAGFAGDGGPATAATLYEPSDVAAGPDGSLYIADTGNQRIRRVAPDGIISTFAGGTPFAYGDNGPATSAWLVEPKGVAIGPDGSLYIADAGQSLIRRVTPNGIITTFAGNGSQGSSGDGGPAQSAAIGYPYGVAVGPDGSLYIADNRNNRVRRVAPSGMITTVVGASTQALGDGAPATAAGLDRPYRVAIGRDGVLYIADNGHNRIRAVQPDGIITTAAGNGAVIPMGENSPPLAASLDHPEGIALTPDGNLVIADTHHYCIRRAGPPVDRSSLSIHRIPSEDGAQLYEFDRTGRHLHTLDAFVGTTIYTFTYDVAGRLIQIADRDGRITTIQRDIDGAPLALLAPDGQRTLLTVDSAGHLINVINPAGEKTSLEYTAEGLLTSLTDPRGSIHSFAYDDQGRLIHDGDPAGGFTALTRSDEEDGSGYTVTTTNALGDATTMRVEMLPGGAQRRVNIAPNGAVTTSFTKPDGTRVITDTRGNVTTSVEAPDPRWGMQVPFVKSLTIKTADGHAFYQLRASRTVRLSIPADPLSLRSQTDTITINGRTTTTIFDAESRTRTTTDPAGKRTVVTLDVQGRVIREETSDLAPKQYIYDSQGRLAGITEGEGEDARTTTLSYDAQGYLASTTDALSGTTSYTYDLAGRMLRRTLPTGHTFAFTYDAAGNRTSSVDPQGLRTIYEYDQQNQLLVVTLDPNGRAIRNEYVYDLAGNLVVRVEDTGSSRLNVTTHYEYTPVGSAGGYAISRMIDPLGQVTRYSYTPSGELSSSTDPLSRTTVLTYTAQGWRGAVTTPGGHTILTTYNDDAQVVSVTDPRGSRTTFTYDAAGRVQSITAGVQGVSDQPAINQTLSYDYDVNGRVIRQVDPRGMITTRVYDQFGRLIEERDPLGNSTNYGYDALDRLVRADAGQLSSAMQRKAYTYDTAGRLLAEQVDPDGLNLTTLYHYDNAGDDTWNLQAVEDPNGNLTTYSYNSLGLRDAVTDALGETWTFEYDNLGRLTNQVDPLGHGSTSTYDVLGRRTGLTQDGRVAHWTYNADGTLATFTDFMGRSTAFAYDADIRLIGVDYPAGTPDVSYTYDAAGNLVEMSDGLGTTSYIYDTLNRLHQRTRDGRTVTYDYTADSQVAQIDYWGRGVAQYRYDDAGRLSSLTPWGAGATSYTYRDDGLLDSQTRGNGVATSYGYDSASRLVELLHRQGALTLDDIRYTLDANSNRTQLADADGTTSYAYDALDRLTQVSYPAIPGGLPAATLDYTLDAVGNRLSDGAASFSYDASDRIASPGYVYDGNGNLISDGATTYIYDGANRLIQTVKGGVTTSYGYDGNGNLVREAAGGVTIDFVLDERGPLPHILGEVRSDGTETLYAYGADGLAAQRTIMDGAPQGVEYPLLDGLGSLRHLTGSDGALTLSRSYDAFGAIRRTNGAGQSRIGFAGEPIGRFDDTIYLRARHYSPALGRFLQRDTFGGFAAQPQSLNRYAYAQNNPSRFTDPSGHCPFCIAVAAGAVIGAAIEYGTQVYGNYQNGQSGWDAWTNVQGDKIGYAAVQGAIAGGVGFVAGPLVGALTKTGFMGAVAAGALEGMTAGGLGQIAVNLLKGCAWDANMTQALLGGGLSGGLGGGLGWAGRKILRSLGGQRSQIKVGSGWIEETHTSRKVVFAGHGTWTGNFVKASELHKMTFYADPGDKITDFLGRAIEYAVLNDREREVFTKVFYNTMDGSSIPELILHPPDDYLHIAQGSFTVDKPTFLLDLLDSFEEPIHGHWAACLCNNKIRGVVYDFPSNSVSEGLLDAIYNWK